jgi:hypothetical protein
MDHGDMARALRQKREGKLNSLGDPWGDWILSEAADMLDQQAAQIARLERALRCWDAAFLRCLTTGRYEPLVIARDAARRDLDGEA